MSITEDKPIKLFSKYLLASFGSAIVMSIYSLVDALCVGQYEGEVGGAALAVVMPLWTIIFSCGLLFGIGGATLMVERRGRNEMEEGNVYYTLAFIGAICITGILWILINCFENPLLRFFGASDATIFAYAKKYTFWMKISLPVFLLGQFFTCFLRNDNAPMRATLAVICGGITNIILDISLVFGCKMGIRGAGLATMIGQFVSFAIICTHFFSKKRQIKFVKIKKFKRNLFLIVKVGIPSFVLDIAMGVLVILFNNQIVTYTEGEEETAILAIYGVICNIVALVQSLGYAVGQASQPLLSENYGAGKISRVKKFLKYGIISCIIISFIAVLFLELFPKEVLSIFLNVEKDSLILKLCNSIERKYFLSFMFLCFNVFTTYYLQSILKANYAFIVSISRGFIISCFLLYFLPIVFGFQAIWYTMGITETIILVINIFLVIKTYRKLEYNKGDIGAVSNGTEFEKKKEC
ncbi:MAG: MATE family efflux transporter [Anaeroplasma bactoclasticum]|nr:MATE family efflux transporter [Anaeroplasma bactoclasticum]MCM1557827.1 MATE family efflux transporter [Anaeroplasma bactoclasticum]